MKVCGISMVSFVERLGEKGIALYTFYAHILVQVIESFCTLHLVMECANHGTLETKIAMEGPFEEDQAKHVFAQLAAGINHMVHIVDTLH